RVARLDVEDHRARRVLERLVVALRRENVERLDEWQTGVDHRRELSGEDHDVAHRDLAGLLLLPRRLVDLEDVQPLLPQLPDGLFPTRRVDRRAFQLAVAGARAACVTWHCSLLVWWLVIGPCLLLCRP